MSTVESLPAGFRFHPTDEELISYYLRNRIASVLCPVSIIAEVDIYKFNPWDLPSKAMYGEREWYFFSPRDRKYPNGARPNRAAASGYWKATGTDKPIASSKTNKIVGVKKALVFYKGKPPKGVKSEWIMHEYRLTDSYKSHNNNSTKQKQKHSMRLDDWVLCRIYKKTNQNLDSLQEGREEEEQSVTEDLNPQILPNSNPYPHVNMNPSTSFALPKSSSLANLLESFESIDHPSLSRLFDNSDVTGLELGFFSNTKLNQPINNNFGSDEVENYGEVYQSECSASGTENAPKRQRMEKASTDGSQYNLVGPPLMNQNFLFDYQFGLR